MEILLSTLNSKFIHTNLAIRYLKAYVKDIQNVDMREYTINNSLDFILKDIYRKKYDLIVFSTYIWNVGDIVKLCETLKHIRPELKIALGGPEVTYDSLNGMEKYDFVDYILRGEGEAVFKDLIRHLKGELKVEEVKGITYRDKDGNICENEDMPLIANMDTIPSPYENINPEEYKNKIVYFESSRGCPFNCQYCLSSAIKGLRYFSVDRIKKDLKTLIEAGVSQIKFIDRTFNANREVAKEVMKFLMENDNGFTTYHFEVTAHLINDDMLEFLKDCKPGLFQFEIGVQSTHKKTLDAVGRKDNFERLSKVVKQVKSYENIHQHLDLIAGLPYENYERFRRSFNEVFNLGIEVLQLGFLKMIKGTGIRNRAKEHDFIYKSYPPYEVVQNTYMTYNEIIKLKDIEEILETYYNSGNFNVSTWYMIKKYFPNDSFSFFEQFAKFYDDNRYFDVSHNKNRKYELFLEFFEKVVMNNSENKIKEENEKNIEIDKFSEILKFDLVSLGKTSSIPQFLNKYEVKEMKNRSHKFLQAEGHIEKYLPIYEGQAPKNIIKTIQFEVFKYNVLDLKENIFAELNEDEYTYLFNYKIHKIFEKSHAVQVEI